MKDNTINSKKLQVLWRQTRIFDKQTVKVISVYSIKECEAEDIAALIINFGDTRRWVANYTPWHLPLNKWLARLQRQSGRFGEEETHLRLPVIELRFLGRLERNLVTTRTSW